MSALNRVYKKERGVICTKLGDDFVIVPPAFGGKMGRLFYLRGRVSIMIWEALNGKDDLQRIADKIACSFDKSSVQIEKDVVSFIKDLCKKGLVEQCVVRSFKKHV